LKELIYSRLLLASSEQFASDPAFVDDAATETFAEHVERVLRLADSHRCELGLGADGRFAVLAGSSNAYASLWHVAFVGGGVINPLNSRYSARELEFVLRDSGTSVIYTDAGLAPLIEQIRPRLPDLETVVLIGTGDVAHDARFEDLVAAGRPRMDREPEEQDLAIHMYTGGTTGLPKGVLHTQRAQTLNVYRMGLVFGVLTRPARFLHIVPMFHVGAALGVLGVPLGGGATVIRGRFDPGGVLDAIERYGITDLGLVPTMLLAILQHPEFEPGRMATVRQVAYGAAPISPDLLAKVLDVFPDLDLVQAYGMTEASGAVSHLGPEDHRRGGKLLESAGRSLPGVEVTIRDPGGRLVKTGQPGEVCVRSGSMMEGYHGLPDETAAALSEGRYRTGDVGYLDERGYLHLVDRAKDMIVSGGENIYSIEVENALLSHPSVREAAVIGVPDDTWGESVHAIVVCGEGVIPTEHELDAHVRARIADYKVPKSFEFRREPLPLSAVGKVLKRELREPHWAGCSRRV
jgi:acyl-CoA synthetase (AMP-forming)/AMP-acid ligase II